jgi:hypothetical protein
MVACGGDSNEGPSGSEGQLEGEELVVQAASYDIAAGEESRFIAGVLTQDQLFVSYGEVEMEFSYLGTEQNETDPRPGPTATGEFLAIDGDPGRAGPIAAPASEGRGVYGADVTFDDPGFWAVDLTAEIDGERLRGRAVFQVNDEHRFPAVGDEAPETKNRTLDSDVPPAAIDSRAGDSEKIPDPGLHDMTIAESIQRGEPTVVVFATPVYCVSRFCGPITDMIEDLSKEYSDRANFIHVEIWFDFQDQAVNKAAAEWLLVDQDLLEPWVYLIDADGTIAERWDNVATRPEVEAALKELPKL